MYKNAAQDIKKIDINFTGYTDINPARTPNYATQNKHFTTAAPGIEVDIRQKG